MSAAAAADSNLMPTGKTKNIVSVIIVAFVILVAWMIIKRVFGGIDSLLETFGLKDTKEEAEAKAKLAAALANSNTPASPFSPAFYKSAPAGSTIVNSTKADQVVKQIWDSVGLIYDDPE